MRGKYTWDKHRIRACFEGVVQIVQFRAMEVLLGPKPKRKATDMEEDAELEEIFEGDTGRHGPHIQLQQPNSVVWFWVLKGGKYKWRKQYMFGDA